MRISTEAERGWGENSGPRIRQMSAFALSKSNRELTTKGSRLGEGHEKKGM